MENMQSAIDKKQIHAPFDGTAGIRTVNPGQMVKVGDPLVSLQALGQVFVDFSLPQQQLADVKPDLPVKVTTDAIPDREFEGKLTRYSRSIQPRNSRCQRRLITTIMRCAPNVRASEVLLPQKSHAFHSCDGVSYSPYGNSSS